MTYKLNRREFRKDGVFSELIDEQGNILAHTLEHAYPDSNGSYAPKIPDGTYICRRGPHRLEGMTADFETFEVLNVPNHSDILFHWGNWNKDSAGCILLGDAVAQSSQGQMIVDSKKTWEAFMATLIGVDTFQLTVM